MFEYYFCKYLCAKLQKLNLKFISSQSRVNGAVINSKDMIHSSNIQLSKIDAYELPINQQKLPKKRC